jgi:hypothetical protein
VREITDFLEDKKELVYWEVQNYYFYKIDQEINQDFLVSNYYWIG